MKMRASRIERMLAKVETMLVPRRWEWLHIIVHEGGDEAETKKRTLEAQEKALAEHIAAHPEDVGRTVGDFFWIVHQIVHVKRREDVLLF